MVPTIAVGPPVIMRLSTSTAIASTLVDQDHPDYRSTFETGSTTDYDHYGTSRLSTSTSGYVHTSVTLTGLTASTTV